MAEPLLLALDQGATSTRAILFDASGQPLATAARPLRQSYPADGWVEHDAEEIFAACVEVLREGVEGSGRPVQDVAAIGITNQRETVVVWDKASGRPIRPAIVWQDRRTAAACEAMKPAEDGRPMRRRARSSSPEPRSSGWSRAWESRADRRRWKPWRAARARGTRWCWRRPSPASGRRGGTRTPGGGVFGLTRDAGLAEIAQAAFDASALQTRDLLEAMRADAPDAFGPGSELRIDGGMAKSAWFAQRLADLTGQVVRRVTFQETTALGAALFAGLSVGIYGSLEDAARARPAGENLEPAPGSRAREAAYARWLDAVARVRS